MVVNNSYALQVAIYNNRTNIFKATLFHIFSHFIAQCVACAKAFLVRGIDHSFAFRELPYILVEATKLFYNAKKSLRIGNHCFYFALAFQHTFSIKNVLNIGGSEASHLLKVEISKAMTKCLLLFQHQQP